MCPALTGPRREEDAGSVDCGPWQGSMAPSVWKKLTEDTRRFCSSREVEVVRRGTSRWEPGQEDPALVLGKRVTFLHLHHVLAGLLWPACSWERRRGQVLPPQQ